MITISLRKIGALVAAGVAAAAMTISMPGQASATPQCNQNTSCYWSGTFYAGTPWVAPTCGSFNLPFQVWSVKNYGHGDVELLSENNEHVAWVVIGKEHPNLPRGIRKARIDC